IGVLVGLLAGITASAHAQSHGYITTEIRAIPITLSPYQYADAVSDTIYILGVASLMSSDVTHTIIIRMHDCFDRTGNVGIWEAAYRGIKDSPQDEYAVRAVMNSLGRACGIGRVF